MTFNIFDNPEYPVRIIYSGGHVKYADKPMTKATMSLARMMLAKKHKLQYLEGDEWKDYEANNA